MIKRARWSKAGGHLDRGAASTPVGWEPTPYRGRKKMEEENEKDGGENALSYHSNFSLTSNILYVEIRGK